MHLSKGCIQRADELRVSPGVFGGAVHRGLRQAEPGKALILAHGLEECRCHRRVDPGVNLSDGLGDEVRVVSHRQLWMAVQHTLQQCRARSRTANDEEIRILVHKKSGKLAFRIKS